MLCAAKMLAVGLSLVIYNKIGFGIIIIMIKVYLLFEDVVGIMSSVALQ